MNRPCRIHFNEDTAPYPDQLPARYREHATVNNSDGAVAIVSSLLVQNAFPIDFAPAIIRTRVTGTKEEDPVDFPLASISMIEWFYGNDVPAPLHPWTKER